MGFTRFNGPVYGAKSLLCHRAISLTSTGASAALVASWVVPAYEDWVITEVGGFCSTCSSLGNTVQIKCEGGSTTIPPRLKAPGNGSTRAATVATVTWGTSTTGPQMVTVTADAVESEGFWVPAGSTLRAVLSSAANAISNLNIGIHGFPRYIDSTRAI